MNALQRISPVVFTSTPLKTEQRNNWQVVLEYSKEGEGPFLVDLSHRQRFDLQDADIDGITPFGLPLPARPGSCLLEKGVLANRMNHTQVSLFSLDGNQELCLPDGTGYTDVTDATLCVALVGKQVFSICEKLTALDFMDTGRTIPFLFQGPFSHVPCQMVTMSRDKDKGGIILTCARGYARDMIHAILDAGEEFGLAPAGELKFTNWIHQLQG